MNKVKDCVPGVYNILIVVLACVIVFPSLPLKFTLQQLAICVFAGICMVVAVYALSNLLIYKLKKQTGLGCIEVLLIAILSYIAIQAIPIPNEIVSILSPKMASLWEFDAYGLKGMATLSADISGTLWFLITVSGYFFSFFLLFRLISKDWHIILITFTVFILGLYQVLFDEVTKYIGYEYITAGQTDGHSYRLTGTFVNSNNLSALINLSIAAGLALVIYVKSNRTQTNSFIKFVFIGLLGLGELILFFGLIKAGSAGGLLSLVLSVFLVTAVLIFRQFSMKVLLSLFIFIGTLLAILIFYGSRELNIVELSQNLSLSGRPLLWLGILEMWKDFPVFGIGSGAFESTFVMYKNDSLTPLRVFTAHSGYLHLAVEMGLIGILLIALFAFAYFKKVITIFNQSPVHCYFISALMVGVLAFMIHECVETNLLIPPVAIPFFGVLALSLRISNLNFDVRKLT